MDCVPGFFCPGTGEAVECETGSTSPGRARTSADCLCQAGFYTTQSGCEPCPTGRYKPLVGNEWTCPFECPGNANSALGTTSLADCFCNAGHFAEVDNGALSRCIDCSAYPNLDAPAPALVVAIVHNCATGDASEVQCGGFGNLCANGSVGMLCGECPEGWARQSFKESCDECLLTDFELTISVLTDMFFTGRLQLCGGGHGRLHGRARPK